MPNCSAEAEPATWFILPESVYPAALAAEALDCEMGAITNRLLSDSDGGPVLVLAPGAHRTP